MAYDKPKSFTEKVQALFQPKITSPIPNAPVDNRSFFNKFQDFFLPSSKVISPLPENDTLNDPGKLYYVAQNQAKEEAARIPAPTFTPKKLEYPQWMANAPIKKSLVKSVSKPKPTPTPAPNLMLSNIDKYLSSSMPASQRANTPLSQYYPAYSKVADLAQKTEDKYQRPGFKTLALHTGFNESTLGRSSNTTPNNIFGFKPPGGSKGYASVEDAFQSYVDHLRGLKGGLYPILKGKGKITKEEVKKLYQNYNPEGAYLQDLLKYFPS